MTLSFVQWQGRGAMARDGGPLPVYGVWGDSWLQDRVVSSLVAAALGEGERDFNFDQLDGESAKVADILAAVGNLPFLSDRRVVLVKRAERVEGLGRGDGDAVPKGKKKAASGASAATRLSEGLTSLPPTTVLILARTPESVEPGERVGERCLSAALDKTIDSLGALINCTVDPKNASLVAGILESEAKVRGIRLERGAATYMCNRCGTDIAFLLGEVEKCALRAGLSSPVTPAVIDEMTRPALGDTIFDLTDALGERNGGKAIATLRELLERGEAPERLMATVVSNLRQLMQARAFLDLNLPLDGSLARRLPPELAEQLPKEGRDNLVQALGAQSWLARRLNTSARRFSSAQLRRALELALEADLAMKGIEGDGGFDSKTNSAATMEIFLARLCSAPS
ncbi:hypothetical protein IAD21_01242 [Abditibacteriota bacterium]|nr:hypothetical protein IAD21_01242 [Abditibacteriota bacterium]